MRSRAWTLRLAALLAGASFGVHQLRFTLAYGSHAHDELARQGHAYLSVLAPVVVGALMIAVAHVAASVLRARSGPRVPSLARLWAIATCALVAAYCAQELAEGMLAPGHAIGFAGVFGGGGWLALPLAAVAALAVALLMRGAAAVENAARSERPWRAVALLLAALRTSLFPLVAFRPFAVALGPRAPPARSV